MAGRSTAGRSTSTARRKYAPSYQSGIAYASKSFPLAKLARQLQYAVLDVLEPIRDNHAALIDLPDLDGRDHIPMVVKIDLA